jgi:hypothetical protein
MKAKLFFNNNEDLIYKNLGPSKNDPTVSCNAIKCIKANAAKTKGNKKCKAKNLFNVALLTEKPPQINSTIS